MANHSDRTFITNEGEQNLLERFKVLIKNTQFFDVLVGYFYTSGFHAIYKSLETTEKIRILIGINTNRETSELIQQAQQQKLIPLYSSVETREHFSEHLVQELEEADDSKQVEDGIAKFREWIRSGKLEIRAYPSENIHAKLYIMSFGEDDRDKGRVITGSSNFTRAGLIDNLEFNVELKDISDYEFAKQKFEELWLDSVDVKDTYLETIRDRTWLNDEVTPYQLYLKFLYEYFKDDLSISSEEEDLYVPEGFKRLKYQEQAVLNAKKILESYGGVFISDVVGLGKTYMSAMLANKLDGRTLVLAPPALLDENNPGSWPKVFADFGVRGPLFQSTGNLKKLTAKVTQKYKNVFIDEAHSFRTESNATYEELAKICRGKRVALVTATPYNNSPQDILSQIKLFQNAKRSTIPNVPDLVAFFSMLERNVKKVDRQKNKEDYVNINRYNARQIREKVLKYLMVRRTRKEIQTYFADDLEQQELKFPEVKPPGAIYYKLNELENHAFSKTIELITGGIEYTRYAPMLYYRGEVRVDQLQIQSQKNLRGFMKVLLIKRLESSFHAFRNTVDRFIKTHETFLNEMDKGNVYVGKKNTRKLFEHLDKSDDVAVQKLLDDEKATRYPAEHFSPTLRETLQSDIKTLKEIQALWSGLERDPKLDRLVEMLSDDAELGHKLIIFSESKETAEYLASELEKRFPGAAILFTGDSTPAAREKIIENFDGNVLDSKNDYRILITTEVLSEGVNLHRSNVIINYDIPWNPTRLMQRVGRINRIETVHDEIYSYTFFPTEQYDDLINLKQIAASKIQAFISLLGADARLLTEGEAIESHKLFDTLLSRETVTGEEEQEVSELKYLQIIRDIRDNDPDLFERIKRLPKKARTAKLSTEESNRLLTYFRKGKLQKFFVASDGDSEELDFINAASRLESQKSDPRQKMPQDFYAKLDKNKRAFTEATTEQPELVNTSRGGSDSSARVVKILRAIDRRQYTEDDEAYVDKVKSRLAEGTLPKQTARNLHLALKQALETEGFSSLKALAIIRDKVPDRLLESHFIEDSTTDNSKPREVILSEYLVGER